MPGKTKTRTAREQMAIEQPQGGRVEPTNITRVLQPDGSYRKVIRCSCCTGPWHGSARADIGRGIAANK